MAAWDHWNARGWTLDYYGAYRKVVGKTPPRLRRSTEDCADLSMKILIYFAAQAGLPVTFEDNDGIHYSSRADFAIFKRSFSWAVELTGGGPVLKSLDWKDDKAKFYEAVRQ